MQFLVYYGDLQFDRIDRHENEAKVLLILCENKSWSGTFANPQVVMPHCTATLVSEDVVNFTQRSFILGIIRC